MANFEVIFASDSNGQLWNTCVRDIVTGATIASYKGGSSSPRTLCLIGSDYLLSGEKGKSFLRVWSIGKNDQLQQQMVCPGTVSALTVTPDGMYCIGAVAEKLYIWQVPTGDLLAVVCRHYQRVTALRCSDDGGNFISGGKDGQVIVWDLYKLIARPFSMSRSVDPEPRHVWSHHGHEVTDIFVGSGGIRARVATCGLDRTCRLYSLDAGTLIFTVTLDSSLSSVVMDPAETHIFLGGLNGKIYQINLFETVVPELSEYQALFLGHTQKVTCLSTSLDGHFLLSGSDDESVRLWDVISKQCIHVFKHSGPITNAFITQTPQALISAERVQPTLTLSKFKRSIESGNSGENRTSKSVLINLNWCSGTENSMETLESFDKNLCLKVLSSVDLQDDLAVNSSMTNIESSDDITKTLKMLKQVNHQLYDFAWNSVLKE